MVNLSGIRNVIVLGQVAAWFSKSEPPNLDPQAIVSDLNNNRVIQSILAPKKPGAR